MLRAGSKSLQSCFMTAGGANVFKKLLVTENLDMIGTRGAQSLQGGSGNDPLGPLGPRKETPNKLTCDAG